MSRALTFLSLTAFRILSWRRSIEPAFRQPFIVSLVKALDLWDLSENVCSGNGIGLNIKQSGQSVLFIKMDGLKLTLEQQGTVDSGIRIDQ